MKHFCLLYTVQRIMAEQSSKWLDPESSWKEFLYTFWLVFSFVGATFLFTRHHYINKIQQADDIGQLTMSYDPSQQTVFTGGAWIFFIFGLIVTVMTINKTFRYRLWREVDVGAFKPVQKESKSDKKKKISDVDRKRRKELR